MSSPITIVGSAAALRAAEGTATPQALAASRSSVAGAAGAAVPGATPAVAEIGVAARGAASANDAGSRALAAAAPPGDATYARRAAEAAAAQVESFMREAGRELEFRVDEGSGRVVVSVRNPSTGELIRQIPDAALLEIATRLRNEDLSAGVLFEEWS